MKEEFLVCVMVGEPAEGRPGERVENPMLSDEFADNGMVCRVVVPGIGDVILQTAGDEQKEQGPAENQHIVIQARTFIDSGR
jgi:hypothetical protein